MDQCSQMQPELICTGQTYGIGYISMRKHHTPSSSRSTPNATLVFNSSQYYKPVLLSTRQLWA